MTVVRVSLITTSCVAMALSLWACSKSDSGKPAGVAVFNGCPVSTETENYPNEKIGDPSGSAIPQSLFSNSPSRLYAVGSQKIGGVDQGLVRISNDGGVSWSTFNMSSGPIGQATVDNAIVVDPSNTNIYIAQTYKNGATTSSSIQFSTNGGQTYKNAPFQLNSQNTESLKSGVIASSGKPYFVGNSTSANNETTGFVITLENDKAVLVKVDPNVEYGQIANLGASAVPANLLISGTLKTDGTRLSWHLEGPEGGKILTGLGDSFPTILDDTSKSSLMRFFAPKPRGASIKDVPPLVGSATSMMVAQDGAIYQGGTVSSANIYDSDSVAVWVIRRSTDSGHTFSIVDSFRGPQFKSSKPLALADFDQHPVAVGSSLDEYPSSTDSNKMLRHWHWHIRIAATYATPWTQLSSSEKSSDGNEAAQAVGVTGADTKDGRSLIILGNSHEGSGVHHWRVEKISSCARPH